LAGDVLAGLGVVDDEILARLHHGRQVFERDVGARAGIVEPPVGVFLDGDRFRSHWCAQFPASALGSIACFF
jgi:hypothetical protein